MKAENRGPTQTGTGSSLFEHDCTERQNTVHT